MDSLTKSIQEAINAWDPIDLLPFAPEDEYEAEIDQVRNSVNLPIDVEILGAEIFRVFTESFGSDVFVADMEECISIACKIAESYQLGMH